MTSDRGFHRNIRNLGLVLCVGIMACSTSQAPELPSWEEFQQAAVRVIDGRTIYIVEWDHPLTLDELRGYYDDNVAHPGTGTVSQHSTVNQAGGQDDVWKLSASERRSAGGGANTGAVLGDAMEIDEVVFQARTSAKSPRRSSLSTTAAIARTS